MLDEPTIDREKPLFLFVNIFDAHDPYPEVPKGIAWTERQEKLHLSIHGSGKEGDDERARQFLDNTLHEADRKLFLSEVKNGYEFGIWRADRSFSLVTEVLAKRGWLGGNGYRLVVTSDHGEFLGERDLLRHGGYLWEQDVHVPVIYKDSSTEDKIEFPNPFPAIRVFDLLVDGKLPDTIGRPQAVSYKNPTAEYLAGHHAVALWDGMKKAMWIEGEYALYDLEADPMEENPLDVPWALKRDLDKLLKASKDVQKRPVPTSEELTNMLEQLGYLDPSAKGQDKE
jgi:hypothetical protein